MIGTTGKVHENGAIYDVLFLLDETQHPPGGNCRGLEACYYRQAKSENPKRLWVFADWFYCHECGTLHPAQGIQSDNTHDPANCDAHRLGDNWRALRWRPSAGHRNYFYIDRPDDHTDCYTCDRAREKWESDISYKRRAHEHGWWVCVKCWGIKFGRRWG